LYSSCSQNASRKFQWPWLHICLVILMKSKCK
jgi:hypothetical protein